MFTRLEMKVLGVDESGGYVGDVGDDEIEGGGEWMNVKRAEPMRQISPVKTCVPLYNQREGRLREQNTCITCAARTPRITHVHTRMLRGAQRRRNTSIYSARNA